MDDLQAAQALVKAEQEQRAAEALKGIDAVLKQYRCQMVVEPRITPDGRLAAAVQVIAMQGTQE
jgi:hypothetical protein